MKKFEFTVKEPLGIHARPAGMLTKEAKKYTSTITLTKGDKEVNVLKLMALMGLGVKCGDTVTVTIDGADEEACAPMIEAFFNENF